MHAESGVLLDNILDRFEEQYSFLHWKLSLDVNQWQQLRIDLRDMLEDALRDAYDDGRRYEYANY